eukprot:6474879-Amphidinium_carterae.1
MHCAGTQQSIAFCCRNCAASASIVDHVRVSEGSLIAYYLENNSENGREQHKRLHLASTATKTLTSLKRGPRTPQETLLSNFRAFRATENTENQIWTQKTEKDLGHANLSLIV